MRCYLSIRGEQPRVDDLGIALVSRLPAPMTISRYETGRAALMVATDNYEMTRHLATRRGLTFAKVATAPDGQPFRLSDVRHLVPPDGARMTNPRADSSDGACAWYLCVDTPEGHVFDWLAAYQRLFYPTAGAGLTYAFLPRRAHSSSLGAWMRRHGSAFHLVPRPPYEHQAPTRTAQAPAGTARAAPDG